MSFVYFVLTFVLLTSQAYRKLFTKSFNEYPRQAFNDSFHFIGYWFTYIIIFAVLWELETTPQRLSFNIQNWTQVLVLLQTYL